MDHPPIEHCSVSILRSTNLSSGLPAHGTVLRSTERGPRNPLGSGEDTRGITVEAESPGNTSLITLRLLTPLLAHPRSLLASFSILSLLAPLLATAACPFQLLVSTLFWTPLFHSFIQDHPRIPHDFKSPVSGAVSLGSGVPKRTPRRASGAYSDALSGCHQPMARAEVSAHRVPAGECVET